jgi:hypothetical protein
MITSRRRLVPTARLREERRLASRSERGRQRYFETNSGCMAKVTRIEEFALNLGDTMHEAHLAAAQRNGELLRNASRGLARRQQQGEGAEPLISQGLR